MTQRGVFLSILPYHHPLKTQNNLQCALDQVVFKQSEKYYNNTRTFIAEVVIALINEEAFVYTDIRDDVSFAIILPHCKKNNSQLFHLQLKLHPHTSDFFFPDSLRFVNTMNESID